MDVLRDTAILNLRNNNIDVLEEQLRQTRDRFNVGEVTRTDVAQAEARLPTQVPTPASPSGNLKTSLARYRQVIGVEAKQLAPAKALDAVLPNRSTSAVAPSQSDHPTVLAALHDVDVAQLQVKIIEGELYPTAGARGTVTQRWDFQNPTSSRTQSTIVGHAHRPDLRRRRGLCPRPPGQGNAWPAPHRGRPGARQVRQNVVSAWGQLEATKERITASQAQIQAAETALNGVREEAKVGQRTTLDVLNAQQELLTARVSLITAQRDRVVASYACCPPSAACRPPTSAGGRPNTSRRVHYEQVRDKWIGLRTPDGK